MNPLVRSGLKTRYRLALPCPLLVRTNRLEWVVKRPITERYIPANDPNKKFIDVPSNKHIDGRSQKPIDEGTGCAIWLRDACNCELCVDRSTTQKLFQTTDIPSNLEFAERKVHPDGKLEITWRNDVPGYSGNHVSTYSKEFLDRFSRAPSSILSWQKKQPQILWDREKITEKVKFLDFDEYMSSDAVLYDALAQLRACGLLFIRGIPDSATAVEDIGGRIGDLKHTFYGRTWDVKSIPQAENIAYTNKVLGLHMDLLYIFHPPSLQFLHCLKNSCEGGESLFSDSFFAAQKLRDRDPKKFEILTKEETTFNYENAGRSYVQHRPAIQLWSAKKPDVKRVNWSPPFQGPFKLRHGISDSESLRQFTAHFEALKSLGSHIEDPKNVYEYRLKEGECVIFDNCRVLHARRAFDTSAGERWFKGAYLDLEVWWQRYVRLHESLKWLHV